VPARVRWLTYCSTIPTSTTDAPVRDTSSGVQRLGPAELAEPPPLRDRRSRRRMVKPDRQRAAGIQHVALCNCPGALSISGRKCGQELVMIVKRTILLLGEHRHEVSTAQRALPDGSARGVGGLGGVVQRSAALSHARG
jgi:hypothetical protein